MELIRKQDPWELWDIRYWQEFCSKARDGHLDLDIHSKVYPEISEKIFPRNGMLSYRRYRKYLILKMIDSQGIFDKVSSTGGVDFYYYPKKQIHDFRGWPKRFWSWIFSGW